MADERCPKSSDDAHCVHWYDDRGPCCWCGDDADAGQSDDSPRPVAGLVAELRRLAAENRADAARFAGTSSPYGFGPNRAARAYEHAAELVEQTVGGGTAVAQGDTVGSLRATLAEAEANGWEGWADS